MAILIGSVETFPDAKADKAQVMKMFEETAEVFSAWEDWTTEKEIDIGLTRRGEGMVSQAQSLAYEHVIRECADLIQATANLLAGLGVHDMTEAMERCRERNEERGRYEQ